MENYITKIKMSITLLIKSTINSRRVEKKVSSQKNEYS